MWMVSQCCRSPSVAPQWCAALQCVLPLGQPNMSAKANKMEHHRCALLQMCMRPMNCPHSAGHFTPWVLLLALPDLGKRQGPAGSGHYHLVMPRVCFELGCGLRLCSMLACSVQGVLAVAALTRRNTCHFGSPGHGGCGGRLRSNKSTVGCASGQNRIREPTISQLTTNHIKKKRYWAQNLECLSITIAKNSITFAKMEEK